MTGCLHESPLGDGAHPKVVLFPKEKEVADRATGALCLSHSAVLITVVTYPSRPIGHVCLELLWASRQGQCAWLRREHFPGSDEVTELGFQKAGRSWPSTPTFFRTWRAVTWVSLRVCIAHEEKEALTQTALFYTFHTKPWASCNLGSERGRRKVS